MLLKQVVKALCALSILCGGVFAQSTTGTLLGAVSDPGDASGPGAKGEMKNIAAGAITTVVAGSARLLGAPGQRRQIWQFVRCCQKSRHYEQNWYFILP